jgi:hypothetical protein
MSVNPVTIELSRLEQVSGGPPVGFDPYGWVIFFSFDGVKLSVDLGPGGLQLKGLPTVEFSKGSQRNFGGKNLLKRGESIAIPASFGGKPLGRWQASLKPFRLPALAGAPGGLPGLPDLPVGVPTLPVGVPNVPAPSLPLVSPVSPAVGVLYVIIEEDASSNDTAEAAHREFNREVKKVLDNLVLASVNSQGIKLENPALSPQEQRAIAEQIQKKVIAKARAQAIKGLDIGSLFNKDDLIGQDGQVFTLLDLAGTTAKRPKTFTSRFDAGKNGVWAVHGRAFLGA